MKQILNLGAGVQSTTILLMALHGELPRPDHVVFADTGWEPGSVYEHLEWLRTHAASHGIQVDVVQHGNIREATLGATQGSRAASLPFFIAMSGEAGMMRRQCTYEYKIKPLEKYMRERRGEEDVETWIGISLDEARRMKVSRIAFVTNRWPLIEKSMGRGHCIEWLKRNGYGVPPKSSCVCCPFHTDPMWRDIKDSPDWSTLVDFDRRIRNMPAIRAACYLHRSLRPIEDIDFSTDVERGQLLLGDECTGTCGT